jgi:hypothetical protein
VMRPIIGQGCRPAFRFVGRLLDRLR